MPGAAEVRVIPTLLEFAWSALRHMNCQPGRPGGRGECAKGRASIRPDKRLPCMAYGVGKSRGGGEAACPALSQALYSAPFAGTVEPPLPRMAFPSAKLEQLMVQHEGVAVGGARRVIRSFNTRRTRLARFAITGVAKRRGGRLPPVGSKNSQGCRKPCRRQYAVKAQQREETAELGVANACLVLERSQWHACACPTARAPWLQWAPR
eukprot:363500-Chlamydomonas_euryale.AAC.19